MNEQQLRAAGRRLFVLHNIHTNKTFGDVDVNSYQGKALAKLKRDELNGGLSSEEDRKWNTDKGWRVTYGPDHWRYTS